MSRVSSDPRRKLESAVGAWMVLCGLMLTFWPAATIRVLVFLVGLGAVAFGINELSRVFASKGGSPELWAGLIGLVNVFGGVIIIITPFVSTDAARIVVSVFWLVGGIIEIVTALVQTEDRLVRSVIGVVTATLGAVVLAVPAMTVVVFSWLAGAWLIVVGAVLLFVGAIVSSGQAELPAS